MIVGESEKVRSAIWKYIIIFVVIIGLSGVMFKFVFMNMILNMGKPKQAIKVETPAIVKKVHAKPKENIKEFRIIGIVDDNYIVKTPKGLKKVKIDMQNKKNINDKIRIEKL